MTLKKWFLQNKSANNNDNTNTNNDNTDNDNDNNNFLKQIFIHK